MREQLSAGGIGSRREEKMVDRVRGGFYIDKYIYIQTSLFGLYPRSIFPASPLYCDTIHYNIPLYGIRLARRSPTFSPLCPFFFQTLQLCVCVCVWVTRTNGLRPDARIEAWSIESPERARVEGASREVWCS